jgi:uncharacterized membrane protein YqjE
LLNPALHLLATRPQWLAEHALAYAELASVELGEVTARARRTLLLGMFTLLCLLLGLGLAGVALMLWAVVEPELSQRTLWVLGATPGLPLAGALFGGLALAREREGGRFLVLRQQLQADLQMLRELPR